MWSTIAVRMRTIRPQFRGCQHAMRARISLYRNPVRRRAPYSHKFVNSVEEELTKRGRTLVNC